MRDARGATEDPPRRLADALVALALGLAGTVLIGVAASTAHAAEPACARPVGRLVSVQGTVQITRGPDALQRARWEPAALDQPLCAGDVVRVERHGRAAVWLSGNETTVRLDQGTTLTLADPAATPSTLDLVRGALHVITRTPRPLRVSTPFVNANVQGTEFLVGAREDLGNVGVLEGRVLASNEAGSVLLLPGERAVARPGLPPQRDLVVRPRDAVQWALHYPTVVDVLGLARAGPSPPADLARSAALYRQGCVAEAIGVLEQRQASADDARLALAHAALLLGVGRHDEAQAVLQRRLVQAPQDADARAVQAVIAVAQNDRDRGLALAQEAVQLDGHSAVGWLALSYAEQARFHLDVAQAAAHKAAVVAPTSALVAAREAELALAQGRTRAAEEAASRAIAAYQDESAQLAPGAGPASDCASGGGAAPPERLPGLARVRAVAGFVALARLDAGAARTSFTAAIAADQGDPLPRLGMGLARIRTGDLAGGREDIEIAASLDPRNPLVRSYLGKAYYEEARDALAGTQLALAGELDPNDPTPWLYDAIRLQADLRPIEALDALEHSIERNDRRAVYRSPLLLDEDRAVRGTSLAAIYQDLGFDALAVTEAAKAVATDSGSAAAHRFLADAYATQPLHDVASESERLQFLLRSPEMVSPVSPLRTQDTFTSSLPRAGFVRAIGPVQPGFNEFSPLFDRDRLALYLDGLVGQHDTAGDQAIVTGRQDRFSFSVGQAHFQTQGFGDNDDLRQNAWLGIAQFRLAPGTSVQAEVRQTETDRGDFLTPFDPLFRTTVRVHGRVQAERLGASVALTPASTLLASAIWQSRDLTLTFPDFDSQTLIHDHAQAGELQWHHAATPFQLDAGGSYVRGSEDFVGLTHQDRRARELYAYGTYGDRTLGLAVTAGLASTSIDLDPLHKDAVDPKLGILWTGASGTTVRLAALRRLTRPLIASQTLEPTALAGFTQLFDRPDGTRETLYGAAVDQKLGPRLHAGVEGSRSRLVVPALSPDAQFDADWTERNAKAYLFATLPSDRSRAVAPAWSAAGSLQYEMSKLSRPDTFTGDEGIVDMDTRLATVGLAVFPLPSLGVRWTSTYVRQTGRLQVAADFDAFEVNERLWVSDVAATYRVPGHRAVLSVGAANLFDRHLGLYQEIDKAHPRFARGRQVFARVVLQF